MFLYKNCNNFIRNSFKFVIRRRTLPKGHMFIDTHAHLNFKAFEKDREEVIKRTLENNTWMINVGTNYETSKKAVEIAQNYEEGIWAAVGLHPIHIDENFDYERYKELAKSEKVVAIGEIGLDYWRKPKTKEKLELFKQKQKEIFLKQLNLAKELNLPVIFHCRLALDELIEILRRTVLRELKGMVHCFTGNWEQAQKFLDMGFYLGLNGIIFKSIEGIDFDEIIKKTPLDRILIETDCPFLVPPISVNQRLDQRKSAVIRNEPLYVKYVAQKIAEVKNISFEEVAEKTTQNAKELFGLK